MELQDYNIFEQRVSTYRTNHIHLCLDGDFNLDFDKMSVRDFASLVHEYVHYLQHFHTLYGLNLCSGFNAEFVFIENTLNSITNFIFHYFYNWINLQHNSRRITREYMETKNANFIMLMK